MLKAGLSTTEWHLMECKAIYIFWCCRFSDFFWVFPAFQRINNFHFFLCQIAFGAPTHSIVLSLNRITLFSSSSLVFSAIFFSPSRQTSVVFVHINDIFFINTLQSPRWTFEGGITILVDPFTFPNSLFPVYFSLLGSGIFLLKIVHGQICVQIQANTCKYAICANVKSVFPRVRTPPPHPDSRDQPLASTKLDLGKAKLKICFHINQINERGTERATYTHPFFINAVFITQACSHCNVIPVFSPSGFLFSHPPFKQRFQIEEMDELKTYLPCFFRWCASDLFMAHQNPFQ